MKAQHIILAIIVLLVIAYIAGRRAGVSLPSMKSAYDFAPTK